MQLGNNRWESTQFNSRLQPTQIGLGITSGTTNLLKLNYSYGTTANNGNVQSQTITVPTVGQTAGFTATQNYEYDSLHRLKSAEETISSQTSWKQTFTFDRYGNRNFDEANTTFAGFEKLCASGTELCAELRKIMNPSVNTANNRLSSSDGYDFDTSGNTIEDAQERVFIYDAENKQVEVRDSQQNIIGQYRYDGDGKRIKKIVPATDEVTVFVYNASGQLVAEYSTEISQTPKVSYTTADHLGSPRILTDENGATISRRDFHPFGEEILTPERTATLGYEIDDIRQKFTSYERDNESEFDYAINRYYNGSHGRFSSVDPYNIIFEKEKGNDLKEKQKIFVVYISQPQIWNKYAYSFNNPLNYSDPDGRRPVTQQEEEYLRRFVESGLAYANEITDPTQRQNFINAVHAAADVIRKAILAVPNDAKEDPKNLRAVIYAMSQIGHPDNVAKWSGAGSVRYNSNGANVTLGAGSNKCTIFVGIAYASRDGANIGWNNNGNTGGYQVNWSWGGNVYTPVANDLVTGGANNFVAVSSPQLGDIAAGHGDLRSAGLVSNTYHQGHAGIVVSGDVVISANPTHGIRVGRFGPRNSNDSTFKYLRYKP